MLDPPATDPLNPKKLLSVWDPVPFVSDVVSTVGFVGWIKCNEPRGSSSTRARLRRESLPAKRGLSELINEDFEASFGSFCLPGTRLGPGEGAFPLPFMPANNSLLFIFSLEA